MIRRPHFSLPAMVLKRLPSGFVYGDFQMTTSARLFFSRAGVGLVAFLAGVIGLWLLDDTTWRDVMAGALLAWSVSAVLWATGSYHRRRDEIQVDLRRVAEIDLLHARLNHLADRLEVPTIGLSWQLEEVIQAREERLAHMRGFEEFRGEALGDGYPFWDAIALSDPDHA